jgi:hypothetical protein
LLYNSEILDLFIKTLTPFFTGRNTVRNVNAKSTTVDHSRLGAWRVSRSLHAEDIFVDFEKKMSMCIVAATKPTFSVTTQLYILFYWQSKVVDPVDPSFRSFPGADLEGYSYANILLSDVTV